MVMSWQEQLKGDPISWLLEVDAPGVRYLALRDLSGCSGDDPELRAARAAAHRDGPIAAVLREMDEAGVWVKPGPGYYQKYRSTVWALILLAQLGASVDEDQRIAQGCAYLLDHALTDLGQFSITGAATGTVDCLQGNLTWALFALGCDDPRLGKAVDWMARTVSGEGIAPIEDRDAVLRYNGNKRGPNFACGYNGKLPCAWGGVKVMLALSRLPQKYRGPVVERAIRQGIDFFFSVDPAGAAYPTRSGTRPSPNWWKFGFPVFYNTDLLQLAEALVALGHGNDPRLARVIDIVREKQDANGCWSLDYDYEGKTWGDFGGKQQPNKWVTLRALRVLKAVSAG